MRGIGVLPINWADGQRSARRCLGDFLGDPMSAIEQSSVWPGGDGLANPVASKLRGLIPALGAISYPFWLDGFHFAVSSSGPLSAGRLLAAALLLLAATAMPLLGLAYAFRLTKASTKAAPSPFELRA